MKYFLLSVILFSCSFLGTCQDTLVSNGYYFHLGKTSLHPDKFNELDSIYNLLTLNHNPDSVEVIYRAKVISISSRIINGPRADSLAHYFKKKNPKIKFKSRGEIDWVDSFNSKDPTYFQPTISFISHFTDFLIHLVIVFSPPDDLVCADRMKCVLKEEDELIYDSGFDTASVIRIDTNLIQKNKKYRIETTSEGGHVFPNSEVISTYGFEQKTRVVREIKGVRVLVDFLPFPDYTYTKKETRLDDLTFKKLAIVKAFLGFYCQMVVTIQYYAKSTKPKSIDETRLKQITEYFENEGISDRIKVAFIQDKTKANYVEFRVAVGE